MPEPEVTLDNITSVKPLGDDIGLTDYVDSNPELSRLESAASASTQVGVNAGATVYKEKPTGNAGKVTIKNKTKPYDLLNPTFNKDASKWGDSPFHKGNDYLVRDKQNYDKENNIYSNPHAFNYANERLLKHSMDTGAPTSTVTELNELLRNDMQPRLEKQTSTVFDIIKALNTYNDEYKKQLDIYEKNKDLGLEIERLTKTKGDLLKNKIKTTAFQAPTLFKPDMVTNKEEIANHRVGIFKELINKKGVGFLIHKPAIDKAIDAVQNGKYKEAVEVLGYSKALELAIDEHIKGEVGKTDKAIMLGRTLDMRLSSYPGQDKTNLSNDSPVKAILDRYSQTTQQVELKKYETNIAQLDQYLQEIKDTKYAKEHMNDGWFENFKANIVDLAERIPKMLPTHMLPMEQQLARFAEENSMGGYRSSIGNEITRNVAATVNPILSTVRTIANTGFNVNTKVANKTGDYGNAYNKYLTVINDILGDTALNMGRDLGNMVENAMMFGGAKGTTQQYIEKYGSDFYSTKAYNEIKEQRGVFKATTEFDKNIVEPASQMISSVAAFLLEAYALTPIFKVVGGALVQAGATTGKVSIGLRGAAGVGMDGLSYGLVGAGKWAPQVMTGFAGGYAEGMVVGDESFKIIYNDLVDKIGHDAAYAKAQAGANIATAINTALIGLLNTFQLRHWFKGGIVPVIRTEMFASVQAKIAQGMTKEAALKLAAVELFKKYGTAESIKSIIGGVTVDGLGEMFEEMGVNTGSQLIGEAYAGAKRYNENGTTQSAWETLSSWDNINQGIWGFIGGAGTNVAMNSVKPIKSQVHKQNANGDFLYEDPNTKKETTDPIGKPIMQDINYNGWSTDRVLARQTIDGIVASQNADMYVIKGLESELEILSKLPQTDDNIALMDNIKSNIFNVGLLRQVQTGLAPYMMMQYEQILNLSSADAVKLGYATNTQDTQYKVDAQKAIDKMETLMNIRTEYQKKYGNNSDVFDNVVHARVALKLEEFLLDDELSNLNKTKELYNSRIADLKTKHGLDDTSISNMLDAQGKIDELHNRKQELVKQSKELLANKSKGRLPNINPATTTIAEELDNITKELQNIDAEIATHTETYNKEKIAVLENQEVSHRGVTYTFKQLQDLHKSTNDQLSKIKAEQVKLIKRYYTLNTKLDENRSNLQLAKDELIDSQTELSGLPNISSLPVEERAAATAIKKSVTRKIKSIENKIKKFEAKNTTLQREMTEYTIDNQNAIRKHEELNKEVEKLISIIQATASRFKGVTDKIKTFGSTLDNELSSYTRVNSSIGKVINKKNLIKLNSEKITRYGKKGLTDAQVENLYKEANDYRTAQLNSLWSLMIATSNGTISSTLLSKDRLSSLLTKLNYTDYNKASDVEKKAIAQDMVRIEQIIPKLDENVFDELAERMVLQIEQQLTDLRAIPSDETVEALIKLLEKYQEIIAVEKAKRDAIITEANDKIIGDKRIADAIDADKDLKLILQTALDKNIIITDIGWFNIQKVLTELAKTDPDAFRLMIADIKAKYDTLLELSKTLLSAELYYNLKTLLSENTIVLQNESVQLSPVEHMALINSMTTEEFLDMEFSNVALFVEEFINSMNESGIAYAALAENNQITAEVQHAFAFNINEQIEIFKKLLYNTMRKQVSELYDSLNSDAISDVQAELDSKLGVMRILENVKMIEDRISNLIFKVTSIIPEIDKHLTLDDITEYKADIVKIITPYINELKFELSRDSALLKIELTTDIENLETVANELRNNKILDSLIYNEVIDNILTEAQLIELMEQSTIDSALFTDLDPQQLELADTLFDVIDDTLSLDEQILAFKNVLNTAPVELKPYGVRVIVAYLKFDAVKAANNEVTEETSIIQTNDSVLEFKLLKTFSRGVKVANIEDVVVLTDHGNDIVNSLDTAPSGTYDLVLEGNKIMVSGTQYGISNSDSLTKYIKSLKEFDLHYLSTNRGNTKIKAEIRTYAKSRPNLNNVEILKLLTSQYENLLEQTLQLEAQLIKDGSIKITLNVNNAKVLDLVNSAKWRINNIPTLAEMHGDDILRRFEPNVADDKRIELFYRPKDSKTLVGVNTLRKAPGTFNQDGVYLSAAMFGHNMEQSEIGMNNLIECEFKKFNDKTAKDIIDTIKSLLSIDTNTFKSEEFYKIQDLFRVEKDMTEGTSNDNYFQIDVNNKVFILNFNRVAGVSTKITFTSTPKGLTFKINDKVATKAKVIDEIKKERPVRVNIPSSNYTKNILPYLTPKATPFKTKTGYSYLMNESIVNAMRAGQPNAIYITGSIVIPIGAIVTNLAVSNTLFPLGGISTSNAVEVQTQIDLAKTQEILSNMIANPNGQVIWSYLDSGVTTLVGKHPDLFIDFTERLHNKIKSIIDNIPLSEFETMNSLSNYKDLQSDLAKYTKDGKLDIPIDSILFDTILLGYNNYYLDSNKWIDRLALEQALFKDIKVEAKANNKIIIITSSFQFAGSADVSLHLVYADQTNLERVYNKTYTTEGKTRDVFDSENDFVKFQNKRSGYSKGVYFELTGYIDELIEPLIPKVNTVTPVEVEATIEPTVEPTVEPTRVIFLSKDQKQELDDYSLMLTQGVKFDEIIELIEDMPFDSEQHKVLQNLVKSGYNFMTDGDIKYQLLQYRDVTLETYNDLVAHIEKKLNVTFNKVALGNSVYGYNRNNALYLNTDMISADTPIHEALGHPVITYIKENNKALYDNLITWIKDNLAKGENNGINLLYNKIKYASRVNNIEMSNRNLLEEVLVNYLSRLLTNKTLKDLDSSVLDYNKTFDDLVQGYIDDNNLDLKLISSKINISQLANILHYNQNISRILESVIKNQKGLQKNIPIKKGVSELFESNPELANQIYEALGFQGSISLESNLKNTGKTEKELTDYLKNKYPEIKLNISNNPIWEQSSDIVKNQEEYNKEVQYRLKATEILLSDKAKQVFNKGNKNKWSLDKILSELAIPKEQKQIILDLNDEDYSFANFDLRESIILALSSNYSYAVEINTAKDKIGSDYYGKASVPKQIIDRDGESITGGKIGQYWVEFINNDGDPDIRVFDTFEEANKAVETQQGINNSTVYSNLTVPGGTNYTENEISTPLITPSIKGHAQFSTNNGIGWFRSDEKVAEGTQPKLTKEDALQRAIEDDRFLPFDTDNTGGIPTKTRRILEIQSDLFQKGRDKEDLTGIPTNKVTTANLFDNEEFSFELNGYEYEAFVENIYYEEENQTEPTTVYYKNGVKISNKEMQIAKEEYKKQNIPQSQNRFLQLLNKDNNWVTFFIKSIVQDSAKKGYEKVLFPKGETAAKIEGHQTIADVIRRVDNDIDGLNLLLTLYNSKEDFEFDNGRYKYENDKLFEYKNYSKRELTDINYINILKGKSLGFQPKIIDYNQIALSEQEINNKLTEANNKKQELKSQGVEKLKPIEAFYEIKVGNILEKQFGKDNVKTITDEYGNQWREISINQSRDLDNILLQKNEANRIIGQANIKAMTVLVDAVNKKEDTIPHEYAHHYIAWFRNTPIVQEAIKRFGSEEALVQAIGEQVVKQKGEAYNWWKKFTNWILNLLSDKQLLQVLTDSFLNRQDLHDFTYNQPNTQQKQQAQQLYSQYLDQIFPNSVVKDIVYHGSNERRDYLDPGKQVRGRFGKGVSFASTIELVKQLIDDAIIHAAIIDLKNPLTDIPDTRAKVQPSVEAGNHDGVQVGKIEYTVPTKEQIHILGSKQDIDGFKGFVDEFVKYGIKDVQYMASAGREYEYPAALRSIYGFKDYKFTDGGYVNKLDQYNKQQLNKELVKINIKNGTNYELKPTSIVGNYKIYLNGKWLKPKLKTTTNNIANVVNTIPNIKVKDELQEIINTDKIDLLNAKLAIDVVAKTELIKADSKSNVGKQLSIIFKDMDGYTSNDDTYRCK